MENSPSLPIGWTLVEEEAPSSSHPSVLLWQDDHGLRIFRGDDSLYEVEFTGIARYRIDCRAKRVFFEPLGALVLRDTYEHLLYDQVLPRILDSEGSLVVHAAAVEVNRQAILFAGVSGMGKSTLSAALSAQGHPLLGDDGVILLNSADQIMVSALYPSLRLLPDSIAALFGRDRSSAPTAHYTPKRRLRKVAVEKTPLPCRSLFVLAPPVDVAEEIKITRLDPTRACMELLRESFALDPSDTGQAARRMEQASRVAELVPTFELAYPRDYGRLPEVGKALIAAVEEVA